MQEEEISKHEKTGELARKEMEDLRRQLTDCCSEMEHEKASNNDLKLKLADCKQVLEGNEQMIRWLNAQVRVLTTCPGWHVGDIYGWISTPFLAGDGPANERDFYAPYTAFVWFTCKLTNAELPVWTFSPVWGHRSQKPISHQSTAASAVPAVGQAQPCTLDARAGPLAPEHAEQTSHTGMPGG